MSHSLANNEQIVIIGAGIAGCQAAVELAPDYDVTVLDRTGIAAGATGLSAGIIAPTLFYGDHPDIARYANSYFRELDGTGQFTFIPRNRLDFIAAEDKSSERERVQSLDDAGFPVSYLEPDRAQEQYPQFDYSTLAGAVYYEDTGWVDPYTYATVLKELAEENGATFRMDESVTDIRVHNQSVTGVTTESGEYDAANVIAAAGWRTRSLLPDGVDIPTRPYRTQCLVLQPDSDLGPTFPLGRIKHEHLYFRPEENGDLLIGGRHHTISDAASASSDADESFLLDVADFLPQFLTGFDSAEFVNGWAGIDVATPDTRPIIDTPIDGPDGLIVATGFNGMGVMVSPAIGPVIRSRLTGVKLPFGTDPFTATRFDDIGSEFEYVSTSDI